MKLKNTTGFSPSRRFSKRRFLQGLGAAAAGLGLLPRSIAASLDPGWDLIVIGGGNSGLPAAIFAARRGARVLIIEAAPVLGGTLFMSGGQMSAAGTRLQKSKGIEDSPQSHFDDIMRISKDTADPELVRLAVFNAAETFDWLMDRGLEVYPEHPVTGTTHEPYSHARYAWSPDRGLGVLKVLNEQIQPELDSGNVTALTSTRATALIQDASGAVKGVVTENQDGETARHTGRHILLSCGGYTSNPEMFEQLEGAKDWALSSYPFSQGAGITLGLAAGGYVRGGEDHLVSFGGIMQDEDYPSPVRCSARHWPPDRPPWEIYVDINGNRFLREDIASHDAHEQAMLAQENERCWVVFDDAIFKQAPQLVGGSLGGSRWTKQDTMDAFESGLPMFYRSDTLAGLAETAGIDGAGLMDTVARYNESQANGQDALGREHMPLPIAKAPYYAIRLQGTQLIGYAGLAVDGALRVIRADGSAIPNLYAAGELLGTGQLMGRSLCGGMMVTPALTFGRLLGQELLPFDT